MMVLIDSGDGPLFLSKISLLLLRNLLCICHSFLIVPSFLKPVTSPPKEDAAGITERIGDRDMIDT